MNRDVPLSCIQNTEDFGRRSVTDAIRRGAELGAMGERYQHAPFEKLGGGVALITKKSQAQQLWDFKG